MIFVVYCFIQGCPAFLCRRATNIIVDYFATRTYKIQVSCEPNRLHRCAVYSHFDLFSSNILVFSLRYVSFYIVFCPMKLLLCNNNNNNNNNNTNQLCATIMVFIDNPNQFNMFRAKISSILRSTRLCLQLVV